jgi:hypothetical protein
MPPSKKDLAMARELLAKAARETDPEKRARLEALADSFWRSGDDDSGLTIDFKLPTKAALSRRPPRSCE